MSRIESHDCGMAVRAKRYAVIECIRAVVRFRSDVMALYVCVFPLQAQTTETLARNQSLKPNMRWEGHVSFYLDKVEWNPRDTRRTGA